MIASRASVLSKSRVHLKSGIRCFSEHHPFALLDPFVTSARTAIESATALARDSNPVARLQNGSLSLLNISAYSFGVSGVWVGFGSILLQFKVTEIVADAPVVLLGWSLDKTSLAAFVSLVGLVIAAVIQPIVGLISDRKVGGVAVQRYPFIIIGLLGLAISTVMFGFVNSLASLLIVTLAMQITSNAAQGPANALIIDHVDDRQRGRASGFLNLTRLAGSGFVAMIVVFLMSNYHVDTAPQWMWYSVAVMVAVLLGTTTYTLLALRVPKTNRVDGGGRAAETEPPLHAEVASQHESRTRFYLFLGAMSFVIAALSATQTNALFYVQDVIGLDNPARGGNYILVTLVGAAAIIVYPAGKLSDRIGRGMLLLLSGILGGFGVLSVLVINADTMIEVVPGVAAIGLAVGIYLSVGWAVANDLVRRSTAARDLSLTSISGLVGATLGRSSGFFIGTLNERGLEYGIDFLGYGLVLGSASVAFFVSGIMFWLVVSKD